jgi:hypothetical protein
MIPRKKHPSFGLRGFIDFAGSKWSKLNSVDKRIKK